MGAMASQTTGVSNRLLRRRFKENIKGPSHWPLWRETTGHRWIPHTKDQYRGKYFHLMTSSFIMKYFYEDKITREYFSLQWRHMIFMASQITCNRSLDHLFNHLFNLKTKKTSQWCITMSSGHHRTLQRCQISCNISDFTGYPIIWSVGTHFTNMD